MEQISLKNVKVGDRIEGFYLLNNLNIRTVGHSATPMMLGAISDQTGSLGCKIWGYDGPLTSADTGNVVYVEGKIGEFNSTPQATLDEFRLAEPGEFEHVPGLVPSAPKDADDMGLVIKGAIASMQDQDYYNICVSILKKYEDEIKRIPAGKSVHHAFAHGLLMHTSNMVNAAIGLAGIYKDFINRDLLLAGTILHDIGKIKEFDLSQLGLVSQYSVQGQLMGHLVIGAQEVALAAKECGVPEGKSMLLQHLLLSHHGEPDFGAAIRPVCAEAFLLHSIDAMDARMETYREQLDKMETGEVSNVIPVLGTRVYKHI